MLEDVPHRCHSLPSLSGCVCLSAGPKQNSLWFHFPQRGIWNVNSFFSNEGRWFLFFYFFSHRATSLPLVYLKYVTRTESPYAVLWSLSDFTGSVLRLDVDTDMCHAPYSIPRSNPHFNSTNQPPEVFAHGLHDPGRWEYKPLLSPALPQSRDSQSGEKRVSRHGAESQPTLCH